MTLLGVPNAASAAAATTAPTFHIGTTTSAAASNNMNLSLGTCVCVSPTTNDILHNIAIHPPFLTHHRHFFFLIYIYTYIYIR